MILSLSSYATDTRVLTMGDNNNILMDDANIWLYPSRIYNYPDIATAEFSNFYESFPMSDDMVVRDEQITRLGVNWKFGGDNPWVLGTYFHNNETFYKSQSDYTVHPYINNISYMPNKRGDFFYGRMLGSYQFGFHFGFVHSSYSEDDGENGNLDEAKFALYNFEFGVTGMNGALDLAAGIEMFTYKNGYTRDINQGQSLPFGDTTTVYSVFDTLKADGNMTLSLRGRYMYEYSPTYTFIPHLNFVYGSYKYEDYDRMPKTDTLDTEIPYDSLKYYYNNDLNFTHEYTYTEIDLGVGMQYTPATNVLAVIDFGVKLANLKQERTYNATGNLFYEHYVPDPASPGDSIWVKADTTFEYKRNMTYFPYFKVGMEADVFKWLDIRLGATSMWGSTTYEYSDYDNKYYWTSSNLKNTTKYPWNATYLGLGFNFNRLHIDCYVEPDIVLDGFNFISGETNSMNYQLSILYEMF